GAYVPYVGAFLSGTVARTALARTTLARNRPGPHRAASSPAGTAGSHQRRPGRPTRQPPVRGPTRISAEQVGSRVEG
ncbi:hypothetical protein, partial [Streptomyces sp. SM14]|uniref:hypothetical protein n=1 Tax=Streptomyces sp. SM14 TaxID=1736045 RepID=UPI001CA4DB7E